ncbi:hypothetical protein FlaCF_1852 [Flavobacterium tructae]
MEYWIFNSEMNLTATFAKGYAKIRKVFLDGTVYARKDAKSQSFLIALRLRDFARFF